jgi:hypothetical protein
VHGYRPDLGYRVYVDKALEFVGNGANSRPEAAPDTVRTVAAELAAGTLRAVPVTGVNLTRTLRAVWTDGRRLTGPAQDLFAVAVGSARQIYRQKAALDG